MNFLVELAEMQYFSVGYCYGNTSKTLLITGIKSGRRRTSNVRCACRVSLFVLDSMDLAPGLDKVLPPDVFKQIVELHTDKSLNGLEKRRKADEIFRKVPKEIREKMPLPPHFEKLPDEVKAKIKEVFFNDSLSFEEKNDKLRAYVKTLPEDKRKELRPPGFNSLPEVVGI